MANLISNLIKKFEFEPNFNLVELELEPEPCDIEYIHSTKAHHNLDLQSLFISQMNTDYNVQALPIRFRLSCNGERAALFIAKWRRIGHER